jgi:hypothetical protein
MNRRFAARASFGAGIGAAKLARVSLGSDARPSELVASSCLVCGS